MSIRIPLSKVPPNKISISFTWDDNSIRHISIIAPLFIENGLRCTFYIVPGDQKFDSLFSLEYSDLAKKGFEIGSHSYSHQYMSSLSKQESEEEFNKAVKKILKYINQYPFSFAFPNHDYNDILINKARSYHLETRNTLFNAIRFSIKTDTSLKDMIEAVDEAISNKTNLIFSGHSIITEEEYYNKQNGEGYQPMRTIILSELLFYLKKAVSKADVLTFSQSALREFIKKTACLQNEEWIISTEQLRALGKFHITQENIMSIL